MPRRSGSPCSGCGLPHSPPCSQSCRGWRKAARANPGRNVQVPVEVSLNQEQRFFVHFLAVAVNELDAVVIVRVVAGGDHDAAVESRPHGQYRLRWGWW